MSTHDAAELGLRERKKLRTRETIARTALDLFSERGFQATTIKDIADAADVAPRTVSGYFPVKEELVFPDHGEVFDGLAARLDRREPGETAVEALRAWLLGFLDGHAFAEHEDAMSRRAVIDSDPALRIYERGLQERGERIVAAAVAVDLGVPADDLLPHMVGAATLAALDALGRAMHEQAPEDFEERAMELIEETTAFIGAGVDRLAARKAGGG